MEGTVEMDICSYDGSAGSMSDTYSVERLLDRFYDKRSYICNVL